MRTTPLLLAAALMLWGWQTGLWWFAVPLAAALEFSRLFKVRWDIAQSDLDRLWNLSAAALGACALYLIASEDNGLGVGGWIARGERPGAESVRGVEAFRRMLQWFPLCVSPMMLAQAWGRSGTMSLATFSWYLRRRRPATTAALNISWIYLASVLVGAGATDLRPGFLAALIALAGWASWTRRSPSYFPVTWGAAYAVAAGLAVVGHNGIPPIAAWIRDAESLLLNRLFDRSTDAMESRTSIGSIGVGQGSGAVAFRIEAARGTPMPPRLREAVYDTYRNTVWQNQGGGEFGELAPLNAEGTYLFDRSPAREHLLKLWLPAAARRLIPHPHGLRRLEQVAADALGTNSLGAVRASRLAFGALPMFFGSAPGKDPAPTPADLAIPDAEAAVLAEVAASLGVSPETAPAESAERIAGFFADKFTYALFRGVPPRTHHTNSTLASFLLADRRGHCEYFGTATTLLLRRAGIPARYVTGWVMPEPERGSIWTLVRGRHAHAWTVAYLNGAWREIDNTPPSRAGIEDQRRRWWEGFGDAWNRTVFEWNRLRYGASSWRKWLFVPATAVAAWLLFQLIRRRGWKRGGPAAGTAGQKAVPGQDSEFFDVVRNLERAGFERRTGETLSVWIDRIRRTDPALADPLRPLLDRHYRLRFDPAGLPVEERRTLREAAGAWIRSRASRR
jgi:protein-glutamine gamma-glutamyltransferase